MNQIVIVVTCYVRQTQQRRGFDGEDETAYELWIVIETRPVEQGITDADLVLQHIRAVNVTRRLVEGYKEAAATAAAGYVEGTIWRVWKTPNDLSLMQAIDFLDGVSENLHTAVEDLLAQLGGEARLPLPMDLVGANVTATLLTKPLVEPIENLTRGLEVAGIFLGLVTGWHPLAVACAKDLIHDQIGDALASTFLDLEEALTILDSHREERAADASEVTNESSTAVGDDSAPQTAPDNQRSASDILKGPLDDDDNGAPPPLDGPWDTDAV